MRGLKIAIILASLFTVIIIKYSINNYYDKEEFFTPELGDVNGENTKKYDKMYSILAKNKIVGLCTQKNENYSCKIYIKNGNKKSIHEVKMLRKGDLVIYSSPSLNFKRKISSKNLIYPFLFNNLDNYKKVYYPSIAKLIDKSELKIHKTAKGYYASPFKYQKLDEIPNKIYYFNVLRFREVNSQKIKKEYPAKYVISFDSEIIPPSDLRQKCKKEAEKVKCILTNNNLVKNNIKQQKKALYSKVEPLLDDFIKRYNLNKYQKLDALIPFLITALHKEIGYQDISKKMSIREILTIKKGDCTEFSEVSVGILRKLGFYAKKIYGLIYKPKKGRWLYHSWVEYQSSNSIKAFDPVNKKAFINLNYLKLGEESKYGIIIIPLDINYINFENAF